MTIANLRAAYFVAYRHPGTLEAFCDLAMPKMFRLLEEIASDDGLANIPNIVAAAEALCEVKLPQKPKAYPGKYDGKKL